MNYLLFIYVLCFLTSINSTFTGDGTVYTAGFTNPDGGQGYNCGFRWLPPKARTYFAALNQPQYGTSENCGRCATVKCVDTRCKSTQSITVMIVDKCPECLTGSLDFSNDAWNAITGISPNRVKISWDWVSCANMVDTTNKVKLATKEGSSIWWYAFQVSNTKYPISNMRILSKNSWVQLFRQDYGFWTGSSTVLTLPVIFQATDISGVTYNKTLSSIVSGVVNF